MSVEFCSTDSISSSNQFKSFEVDNIYRADLFKFLTWTIILLLIQLVTNDVRKFMLGLYSQ